MKSYIIGKPSKVQKIIRLQDSNSLLYIFMMDASNYF